MFLPIQNVIQRQNRAVKFQLWELPARPDIATLHRTKRSQVIRNGARPGLVVLHEVGRHLASRMPIARLKLDALLCVAKCQGGCRPRYLVLATRCDAIPVLSESVGDPPRD